MFGCTAVNQIYISIISYRHPVCVCLCVLRACKIYSLHKNAIINYNGMFYTQSLDLLTLHASKFVSFVLNITISCSHPNPW